MSSHWIDEDIFSTIVDIISKSSLMQQAFLQLKYQMTLRLWPFTIKMTDECDAYIYHWNNRLMWRLSLYTIKIPDGCDAYYYLLMKYQKIGRQWLYIFEIPYECAARNYYPLKYQVNGTTCTHLQLKYQIDVTYLLVFTIQIRM